MRCPMCATRFTARDEAAACAACPLHAWTGGCALDLVACPSCGYHALPAELAEREAPPSFPPVGASAELPDGGEAGVPLREVSSGSRALVASITGDADIARRLIAYGVSPGARIELVQRTPAYVVRVDATELAFAPEIAAEIRVVPTS